MINETTLAQVALEILDDINSGACHKTVTQTAQILDLGNGKKAAVRITVTTEEECFL
jgi:hypothetical protein